MSSKIDNELEKVVEVLSAIDKGRVSVSDFAEVVGVLVQFAKETRDLTEEETKRLKSLTSDVIKDLKEENKESLSISKGKLNEYLDSIERRVDKRLSEVKDGSQGEKGERGETGLMGTDGKPGKDGSPDTPQQIVDKVQSLKEGSRWEIEDVNGLEDELSKIKKLGRSNVTIFGGAGQGGRIVKFYDISDSLNGSTKTFSLPAFFRVLQVTVSSFPTILRPTIDYTIDGSAMTITFTSEIDETTTLARGQSVMILYSEV